jgi:benzoyl-CoA reductase/2-hydroxyglutaryl-CoA dehydratase subunit BcrC/BadD/HgdB
LKEEIAFMLSNLVRPFGECIQGTAKRFRALASDGKQSLGYFCTYTPIEIIHAAGLLPLRVTGETGTVEKAYSLTPNFICPYMLRSLEKALNGEYDFLSGMIQGYTCDVTCGLMNIWKENVGRGLYHTLPLPYADSPEARTFFRSGLMELVEKLESVGGKFSNASLERSLELYGSIRNIILALYDMRYANRLPLSAEDLLYVVQAGFVTPPEAYVEMLRSLLGRLKKMEGGERKGLPIFLSGSLIEAPEVLGLIEASGMRVAGDDLCTGLRHFHPAVGKGGDPLDRLMDRYLRRFPCPARARAENRVPLMVDLIRRSGALGVVFMFQKFCTPHLADHPILSEELGKEGIPSILVEMDEMGIMESQMRTRLEGFSEMLGK